MIECGFRHGVVFRERLVEAVHDGRDAGLEIGGHHRLQPLIALGKLVGDIHIGHSPQAVWLGFHGIADHAPAGGIAGGIDPGGEQQERHDGIHNPRGGFVIAVLEHTLGGHALHADHRQFRIHRGLVAVGDRVLGWRWRWLPLRHRLLGSRPDAQWHTAHRYQHADSVTGGQDHSVGILGTLPPATAVELRPQGAGDLFLVILAGNIRRSRHVEPHQIGGRDLACIAVKLRQFTGFRHGGVIQHGDDFRRWRATRASHAACQQQ